MSLKHQWYFGSLCLVILLTASCASQPVASYTVDHVIASATAPVQIVPDNTTTPNLIPKQNDLIFIEFFAIT